MNVVCRRKFVPVLMLTSASAMVVAQNKIPNPTCWTEMACGTGT